MKRIEFDAESMGHYDDAFAMLSRGWDLLNDDLYLAFPSTLESIMGVPYVSALALLRTCYTDSVAHKLPIHYFPPGENGKYHSDHNVFVRMDLARELKNGIFWKDRTCALKLREAMDPYKTASDMFCLDFKQNRHKINSAFESFAESGYLPEEVRDHQFSRMAKMMMILKACGGNSEEAIGFISEKGSYEPQPVEPFRREESFEQLVKSHLEEIRANAESDGASGIKEKIQDGYFTVYKLGLSLFETYMSANVIDGAKDILQSLKTELEHVISCVGHLEPSDLWMRDLSEVRMGRVKNAEDYDSSKWFNEFCDRIVLAEELLGKGEWPVVTSTQFGTTDWEMGTYLRYSYPHLPYPKQAYEQVLEDEE